eukprot:Hpha_TRINITY_DN19185_c0_g1::TRINITY_DN19185_c0_g1_i1::g.94856::m.94856
MAAMVVMAPNGTAVSQGDERMCECWALAGWLAVGAAFAGVTTGVCAFGAALAFMLVVTLARTVWGEGTGIGTDMTEVVATAPLVAIVGQAITLYWRRGLIARRGPLVAATLPLGGAGLILGRTLLHSLNRVAARSAVGVLFLCIAVYQLTLDLRAWAFPRAKLDAPDPPARSPRPSALRRIPCAHRLWVSLKSAVPEHSALTPEQFVPALLCAAFGSGALFGMISAPGPPMAAFFAYSSVNVDEARVFTSPLAGALYVMSIVLSFAHGTLRPELLFAYAPAWAVAAAGFAFGSVVLAPRVSVAAYRRGLYVLLIVSGLNLANCFHAWEGQWFQVGLPPAL